MIYLLVFIYLLFLSLSFDFLKIKGPKIFFYDLSMVILILITGLRWKVGGDSITYQLKFETLMYPISEFSKTKFEEIGWEPGYILINSISKFLVPEFWFFQMIHAVFVNVIIFRFFKRYTPYYFTAVLLYSIFYYFYFNMEILREVIPVCIFAAFMYPAMVEKKYQQYYIINIILLFFHHSAFILLLVPILASFKINRSGIISLSLLWLAAVSIFTFFPKLFFLISLTDSISSKFIGYSKYSFNSNGVLYNFICFAVFPYFLLVLNRKYMKDITFEKLVFPYFFIVAIYISYAGFGRLINYFGLFMLVFFVNTLYIIMHTNRFKKIRFLMVIMLMAGPLLYKYQFYSIDTSRFYKKSQKINLWYPYSSIFNKEDEYKPRFIIYTQNLEDIRSNQKK